MRHIEKMNLYCLESFVLIPRISWWTVTRLSWGGGLPAHGPGLVH